LIRAWEYGLVANFRVPQSCAMKWDSSRRSCYRWQKEFFENGAAAFQAKARSDHQAEQERIDFLQKKIQRKDEVLAELMAEHIALKKELGEL